MRAMTARTSLTTTSCPEADLARRTAPVPTASIAMIVTQCRRAELRFIHRSYPGVVPPAEPVDPAVVDVRGHCHRGCSGSPPSTAPDLRSRPNRRSAVGTCSCRPGRGGRAICVQHDTATKGSTGSVRDSRPAPEPEQGHARTPAPLSGCRRLLLIRLCAPSGGLVPPGPGAP